MQFENKNCNEEILFGDGEISSSNRKPELKLQFSEMIAIRHDELILISGL
jgi:hypothetical protein